ncbi:hypothetical protein [Burkholderia alba]|uniref:hypothetical protein n=1 Tax=Burkholderia alba TaxID=2683677 RepID=UPI0038990794
MIVIVVAGVIVLMAGGAVVVIVVMPFRVTMVMAVRAVVVIMPGRVAVTAPRAVNVRGAVLLVAVPMAGVVVVVVVRGRTATAVRARGGRCVVAGVLVRVSGARIVMDMLGFAEPVSHLGGFGHCNLLDG